MPIPFLVAGLGVAAGALGVMGHSEAKGTNEKAQNVSRKAQKLYEDAKDSLEIVQKETQETLLDLGYSKKNVLEGSIKEFLKVYDQIKNIRLSKTTGLNEIVNFAVEQKDVVELREMSNIYESALSNSAAGVATGAIIALAASGSLSIVTGTLSLAGTALAWGEIGLAASFAGSALAAGAALTPLAAVAAPVVFFTGISASIKADENLEKAEAMYAEADAAAEKMKLAETLCEGIGERAEMFKDLLDELDEVFSECTEELSNMVRKKTDGSSTKTINANDLTEEELELIAVTRSLAGAVKSIIDTPILNKEGNLTDESEKVYEKISSILPEFATSTNEDNFELKVDTSKSIDKCVIQNKKIVWGNFEREDINLNVKDIEFIHCEIIYGNVKNLLYVDSEESIKFSECIIADDRDNGLYEWRFLCLKGKARVEFDKCQFINCKRMIWIESEECKIEFNNCHMEEPEAIIDRQNVYVECNINNCNIIKKRGTNNCLFRVDNAHVRKSKFEMEGENWIFAEEAEIYDCSFKGGILSSMNTLKGEIHNSVFENCNRMELYKINYIENVKLSKCNKLTIYNFNCIIDHMEVLKCNLFNISVNEIKNSIIKECEGESTGSSCNMYVNKKASGCVMLDEKYFMLRTKTLENCWFERCENIQLENYNDSISQIKNTNFINIMNDDIDMIYSNNNLYIQNSLFDKCHTIKNYIINFAFSSGDINDSAFSIQESVFNDCSSKRNDKIFINDIVEEKVLVKPKIESTRLFGIFNQRVETSFAVAESTGRKKKVGNYINCIGINERVVVQVPENNVEEYIKNNPVGYKELN